MAPKQRIDFVKYGKKRDEEQKEEEDKPGDSLPRTSIVISSTLSIKSENALKRIGMKSRTIAFLSQVHIVHIFGCLALRRGFDPFCLAAGNP